MLAASIDKPTIAMVMHMKSHQIFTTLQLLSRPNTINNELGITAIINAIICTAVLCHGFKVNGCTTDNPMFNNINIKTNVNNCIKKCLEVC